jgi:hypothetical protein
MRRRRLVTVAALSVAALVPSGGDAAASENRSSCAKVKPGGITINPSDRLSISGFLAEAEDLTGILRLKARKATAAPFVLAGPLPGGKLEVSQPSALPANEPREVTVTAKSVRTPGTYRGSVTVFAAGERCTVEVEVDVAQRPVLGFVFSEDKSFALSFAKCKGLGCEIAGDENGDCVDDPPEGHRVACLPVDNPTATDIEVTDATIALRGDYTEDVGEAQVELETPFSVPAGQSVAIPVVVDAEDMASGRYAGALQLTTENGTERLELPLTIDVKDGPLWPIVTLLAALGFLGLAWWVRRLAPQTSLLSRWWRERLAIRRAHPDDRAILAPQLKAARALIFGGAPQTADMALKRVANVREVLAEARTLEERARKAGSGQVPERVRLALAALRDAAVRAPETVNRYLADVKASLAAAERGTGTGQVSAAAQGVGTGTGPTGVSAGAPLLPRVQVLLASLFVGPLLRAVIVVLFLLTGLKELYIDDATFGDHWFRDYGFLLLWGVGAAATLEALNKAIGPKPPPKPGG